jgi:hypothetical protein
MILDFLSANTDKSKQEIVNSLYQRLADVRRCLEVKVSDDDEFDLGINCRLANEEMWLIDLLDKIERS